MFDTAAPKGKPPACPPGFDMVNTASSAYTAKLADGTQVFAECLRVKKGMQTAAAFLESRRVAAARGATTQFEKQEGFTFDPATRRAYFSVSRIAKGLTNDTKHTYASEHDDAALSSSSAGRREGAVSRMARCTLNGGGGGNQ